MASNPRRPLVPLDEKKLTPADLWDAKVAKGMSPDEATKYVASIYGMPQKVQSDGAGRSWKPEDRLGTLGGTVANINAHIPFGDEMSAVIETAMTPAVQRREAGIRDTYNKVRGEQKKDLASFKELHPKAAFASGVGTELGKLALSAPLGAAKGAALIGGLEAAGEGEGLAGRTIGGVIGTGLGYGLGAGADWVTKNVAGGGRKIMTGLGAYLMGKEGDTPLEKAEFAAAGGAGVNLATRGAGIGAEYVANKVNSKLTGRSIPEIINELGKRDFALSAEREGIKPGFFSKQAETALPGTKAYHVTQPGGNVQGLMRAAESIPGEGKTLIRKGVAEGRLSETPATKSVRRALGNRFTPENPIVAAAEEAVSREAGPAYEAIAGRTVKNPHVFATLEKHPELLDMLESGANLARGEFRAGMNNAEDIPALFERGEDGAVKWLVDEIPVKAINYMKQGLDELVERGAASGKVVTRGNARILDKLRGDVVKLADDEVPEFATARKAWGTAEDKQVQGLSKRVEADRFVVGGSPTARIEADQGEMALVPTSSNFDINPKKLLGRVMNSQVNGRLRGLNALKAESVARIGTKDLTPEGAAELDNLLTELLDREAERRARGGLLPRAASLGVGALVGRSTTDKRQK